MLSIFDCEIPSNVSRAFSSDEIKGVIGVVLLIATRIATALPSSLNVFQFPRTCYFFFFYVKLMNILRFLDTSFWFTAQPFTTIGMVAWCTPFIVLEKD